MSLIKPTPNPPTLATWLLERLASRNEALAGDLFEEFRQGRSARWYWRQTLAAIAIAFSQAILSRAAVLLFTILWCAVVPNWLLAITAVEAHFNTSCPLPNNPLTHLRPLPNRTSVTGHNLYPASQ